MDIYLVGKLVDNGAVLDPTPSALNIVSHKTLGVPYKAKSPYPAHVQRTPNTHAFIAITTLTSYPDPVTMTVTISSSLPTVKMVVTGRPAVPVSVRLPMTVSMPISE